MNTALEVIYKGGVNDGTVAYAGKIYKDIFFRNFSYSTATLWKDQEFGINVEIFDWLKAHDIKLMVYINTKKNDEAHKITLEKFDQLKIMKEYSYGKQYFVKTENFELVTKQLPKIPFIKMRERITINV